MRTGGLARTGRGGPGQIGPGRGGPGRERHGRGGPGRGLEEELARPLPSNK